MASNIKLVSDFVDYYDLAFNSAGSTEYKRMLSESMPKGKALNWLRLHNIPSIETKPVNAFSIYDRQLVVYTDPKLHSGKGKIICSYNEAINNYGNYLGSAFVDGTDGISLKFLQVGSRRFRIMMKNDKDGIELNPGIVTDISELKPEFNYFIYNPVFSIDYISCNNKMLAVDFNEVQSLSELGIDKLISPEDVVAEIEKSLRRTY